MSSVSARDQDVLRQRVEQAVMAGSGMEGLPHEDGYPDDDLEGGVLLSGGARRRTRGGGPLDFIEKLFIGEKAQKGRNEALGHIQRADERRAREDAEVKRSLEQWRRMHGKGGFIDLASLAKDALGLTPEREREIFQRGKKAALAAYDAIRGKGVSGGARKSKGVRHCVRKKSGPSGKMRCARYSPSAAEAMAMASLGEGFMPFGGPLMPPPFYGGVRHCVREKRGPSGKKRCARYRGAGVGGGVRGGRNSEYVRFLKAYAKKHRISYKEAMMYVSRHGGWKAMKARAHGGVLLQGSSFY